MTGSKSSDYRIKKIEKGPLQRFKNQNLLIKKFGEIGLQIYKAITGKRTTGELREDLGIDPSMFDKVLTYMQEAGMVELEPVAKKAVAGVKEVEEKIIPKGEEEILPEEVEGVPTLEELPEEEPIKEEEALPLEEKPQEEKITFEEIEPIGIEEKPEELEKEEPKEIPKEELPPEEKALPEEKEKPLKEIPLEEVPPEEISALPEEEKYPEEPSELSPVEKIISDKYGDIGLQVYSLIDGQRTAEEIMSDTGLSEPKLVEILDFMDEQGIIKLDYPKGGGKPPPTAPPPAGPLPAGRAPPPPPRGRPRPPPPGVPKKEAAFVPILDDKKLVEARAVPSPVELPIKAPLDIVKSVQMKAKIMLKYGNKGGKILERVDGKNDIIDISLKLDMPLYSVSEILTFMFENGMLIMKPLTRTDVRQKYGDDGYSVYKRYGKEGLMLYELIGKELTIKQMADKVTTEKETIVDMFVFIHQVLGIELPIDKDMLAKQLGL